METSAGRRVDRSYSQPPHRPVNLAARIDRSSGSSRYISRSGTVADVAQAQRQEASRVNLTAV
jgi:hypothetical protein